MNRISRARLVVAIAVSCFAAAFVFVETAAAEPAIGDPAPDFALPGTDGNIHRLADSLGDRGVVLAWFPKAFTPG